VGGRILNLYVTTARVDQLEDKLTHHTTAWPTFFLVGAMKAGTTSLANLLARHPDVYLPPIKEPNFFCEDINAATDPNDRRFSFSVISVEQALDPVRPRRAQVALVRDAHQYLALYRAGAGYRHRGDCSTAYLFSASAAAAIAAVVPTAKILVMVREPVARAISEHRMRRVMGSARASLVVEIEAEQREIAAGVPIAHGSHLYLRAGQYAAQIQRYRQAFGPESVLVVVFEEFVRDQQAHFDQICDFLEIRRIPIGSAAHANEGKMPRSAWLNRWLFMLRAKSLLTWIGPHLAPALKRRLLRIWFLPDTTDYRAERSQLAPLFAAEIAAVEALLGRPLPHWRAASRQPPEDARGS
jgi:hypothetical protein